MKLRGALQLLEQASPSNPPSGWVSLLAKAGGVLWIRTSAGTERLVEPGILFVFSSGGPTNPPLVAGAGTSRIYNDTGAALAIKSVRASVGTAPTGASIIVDVNIGGSTIFATQANRPTIAAGANTSGKIENMNTATIADGAYFTVDLDQVGSTFAGAQLTVQILC